MLPRVRGNLEPRRQLAGVIKGGKALIQARRDYVVARSEIFVPAGVIPIH